MDASRWIFPSLLACLVLPAWAQQPAPAGAPATEAKPAPQHAGAAEDLEPAVNTSATPSEPPAAAPATAQGAPSEPARTGAVAAPASAAPAPAVPAPAVPAPARATPAGTRAAKSARGGKAMDHLELETTDITGNRELPKVLYIVPWKSPDLGDVVGKPVNSLLDEVLQPVDRDVFRRENRYYRALTPPSGAGGSGAPGQAGAARNPGGGAP